ncbi:hypothetical protein K502DRAFT_355202 [Neoconidiobolus thromboides FSU 785]|nr:hypothetical protein K502DRAFT_355202 [Neoconidiobolus thromboides FSU 785]
MSSDKEAPNLQTIINSGTRKVRKVLTLSERQQVAELYKQGYSHQELADQYQVGRSTITKLLLRQEKVNESGLGINQIRKQRYYLSLEYLEKFIINHFCDKTTINEEEYIYFKTNVTMGEVMNEAQELATELGIKQFKATNHWFNKFRRRHCIKFRYGTTSYAVNNTNSLNNVIESNVSLGYEITLEKKNFNEQSVYPNDIKTENSINNINVIDNHTPYNILNQNNSTEFSISDPNVNANLWSSNSYITYPIQYTSEPNTTFSPASLIAFSTQYIMQPVTAFSSIPVNAFSFEYTTQPNNTINYFNNIV